MTNKTLRTAALIAAATVTISGCNSAAETTSSTSSTNKPAYDEPMAGGDDPAYQQGMNTVKKLQNIVSFSRVPFPKDSGAEKYATPEFIAKSNKENAATWDSMGYTSVKNEITYLAWRGTQLNKNTERFPWKMELGVCRKVVPDVKMKKGTFPKTPQITVQRYTLVSKDKGKTWLVDNEQLVPHETQPSKFDPPCKTTALPTAQ